MDAYVTSYHVYLVKNRKSMWVYIINIILTHLWIMRESTKVVYYHIIIVLIFMIRGDDGVTSDERAIECSSGRSAGRARGRNRWRRGGSPRTLYYIEFHGRLSRGHCVGGEFDLRSGCSSALSLSLSSRRKKKKKSQTRVCRPSYDNNV